MLRKYDQFAATTLSVRGITRVVVAFGLALQFIFSLVALGYGAPPWFAIYAVVNCALGLLALSFRIRRDMPAMLRDFLLVGFVWGYQIKFYLAYNAGSWENVPLPLFERHNIHLEGADALVQSMTFAFATICAALWLVGKLEAPSSQISVRDKAGAAGSAVLNYAILLAIAAASVGTTILTVEYGIAVGGNSRNLVELPFRLGGIIYWTRALLIPSALAILYYEFSCTNLRRYKLYISMILVGHAVGMTWSNASRGALVFTLLPTAFIAISRGVLKVRTILISMSFLIFVGSIHPVLSALRTLRMSHERELISATKNALEASDYTQGSPGGGIVTEALAVVAGRYVGAEGALHAFSKPINFDIAGNYDAYFSRGLLEFSWAFTAEFAGYGYAENYTGGAPSFVGASYMLAGFWGLRSSRSYLCSFSAVSLS